MNRYIRNIGTLCPADQEKLLQARVCVVGCGGLGGYVIEMLARLGVGQITVVDGDVFKESNLNRQILANIHALGKNKASEAKERIGQVNPDVSINAIEHRLTADNARMIVTGHAVLVDALDDIDTRFLLQKIAEEIGIVLVHGGVDKWYGQVCTIFPGDRTLDRVYANQKNVRHEFSTASFVPPLVAAVQVSEVLKVIIGRGELLRGKVLFIDLLDNEFQILLLTN